MDRDKLILIGLGAMFIFLLFAFLGVVAVTGYFFFTMNPSAPVADEKATLSDDVPLIDTIADTNVPVVDDNSDEPQVLVEPSPEPVPVCGNNLKESGEQCEVNSHCSAAEICSACKCIPKPVEEPKLTKLDNIIVQPLTELNFFCAPDFQGKKGLAINKLFFKNTGTADYSILKPLTIKTEINSTTDEVKTKTAYRFSIKAGKTADIYAKDIARETAPYLFLGTVPGTLKITVQFGDTKYIEYTYDVKATDFGKAGCL